MRVMLLHEICDLNKNSSPLKSADIPKPVPGKDEVLIRVKTCGVCHTEIDEIEGRTPPGKFPVVPGHQVVGIVEDVYDSNEHNMTGKRVGVAWIYSSCGKCKFCLAGQ